MPAKPIQAKEFPKQILIVEDDGIIARDIKLMLQELGYETVGIAASGAEALAIAARKPVDLVLMDVRIRGEIDGIQTAAELLRHHYLPIVYLTAHTDDLTVKRATATEPFGYVTKPVSMDDLKVGVAVALTRFEAERQVQKRENSLQKILENTTEALVIIDSRGNVSFLNRTAAELAGVDPEEVKGQSVQEVLHIVDQDGKRLRLQAQPSESAGQDAFRAGTLVRPDQTKREVLFSIAPVGDDAGAALALQDISQFSARQRKLQETNRQLASSNEKLTLLSQTLTHDLREPLRTVSLYSGMLAMQEGEKLSKDAKDMLDGIAQASRRMASLMSSLLEYFTASDLNRDELRFVDSNTSLREALSNLDAAIRGSRAQIEAVDLPMVYSHPTALMLVFQNLIGNAIKYAGLRTPRVRVSADRQADYWRFTVADNGVGFSPEYATKIFDLFGRAHSRECSGNGIGLATCHRLIEQQQGRIWAESQPGEGSRFYFTVLAEKSPAPTLTQT